MATFTVHLPPPDGDDIPPPEKIVFLRDGFSAPAFVFGPFWLLWKRAWIPAAGWTTLLLLIAGFGAAFKIPSEAMSFAGLAVSGVLGFEGERLLAWSLRRRGYTESDVVIGDNQDEAEEVFFHRWGQRAPEATPAESTV